MKNLKGFFGKEFIARFDVCESKSDDESDDKSKLLFNFTLKTIDYKENNFGVKISNPQSKVFVIQFERTLPLKEEESCYLLIQPIIEQVFANMYHSYYPNNL